MKNKPGLIEKLICVLTYYTFGAAGIIWLVICALTKKNITGFCKFHIYQSIFFSVVIYLVTLLAQISLTFMLSLPFIGSYIKLFIIYVAQTPIYMGLSLVHFVVFAITSYLAIFALFGKYSYFPFISDMVKSNLEIE